MEEYFTKHDNIKTNAGNRYLLKEQLSDKTDRDFTFGEDSTEICELFEEN